MNTLPAEMQQYIKVALSRYSTRTIASWLGISKGTVIGYRKLLGIERRPTNAPRIALTTEQRMADQAYAEALRRRRELPVAETRSADRQQENSATATPSHTGEP